MTKKDKIDSQKQKNKRTQAQYKGKPLSHKREKKKGAKK